jgi:outer membrane protein
LVFTETAFARDLVGVYGDALRNDPQIRAADANWLASRESRPQALASLLPQISGNAAYARDPIIPPKKGVV